MSLIGTTTESAPAKLNLVLDVTGKREDGYHTLETIFYPLHLCDTVTISVSTGEGINILCNQPECPCDESNIVWKAAKRFLERTNPNCHVDITLVKVIPMQAGLGGGSTDGAAVLRGLQKIFGNPLAEAELLEIATSLGADVPFFLKGQLAYAEGIGEYLVPIPVQFPVIPYLMVAKGKSGVSTADAYHAIDELEQPDHPQALTMLKELLRGMSWNDLAKYCGNLFEQVTDNEEVNAIEKCMMDHGALCSVMTGSGSAVFGIFPTEESMQTAAKALGTIAEFIHTESSVTKVEKK